MVAGSIPAGRTRRKKSPAMEIFSYVCETECDGTSQGRANFQQKIMPDHMCASENIDELKKKKIPTV